MQKFNKLTSVAAPLREADVDTDVIFPPVSCCCSTRPGLGSTPFTSGASGAMAHERTSF